jgi:hypothetical protein
MAIRTEIRPMILRLGRNHHSADRLSEHRTPRFRLAPAGPGGQRRARYLRSVAQFGLAGST